MRITEGSPLQYALVLDGQDYLLNPWISQRMLWSFTGSIRCQGCHTLIKKSYQNGYCYRCTQRLAACDLCIVKPELCHFAAGTCREPEWGLAHCMQPHAVYLAYTSGVKVGITRLVNVPTRWYDQGAVAALHCFTVPTRLDSGVLELALAQHVADKTYWRKMLDPFVESEDLLVVKERLLGSLLQHDLTLPSGDWTSCVEKNTTPVIIQYPLEQPIHCWNRWDPVKNLKCSGRLLGMKGQYCIFDNGIINIRKYTGYEVEISAG